jgi:uncharacterized membrane protein YagU involved in acid resistance
MNTVQSGIWAGILATGPMTLSMFGLQELLPASQKSPLPPATLAHQFTQPLGKFSKMISSARRADLTMTSHLGYGMACGILYSLMERKWSASPLLKGSLFGMTVWTASYLGWIPALGLRASAYKMPAKRNALMIFSHLVWGASLGFAESEMRKFGYQMLDGARKAPKAE